MKRKEFEKFLLTEAFQCPQCKRKEIRFAAPEQQSADEVSNPVALRCATCSHVWTRTFRDYDQQAEALRQPRK